MWAAGGAGGGGGPNTSAAGRRSPRIDPADPDAAIKIMWNYDYKPLITDDVDLEREFLRMVNDASAKLGAHSSA